jgi:hypothetical protein
LLKDLSIYPHQQTGIEWMIQREEEVDLGTSRTPGGVLADQMVGL